MRLAWHPQIERAAIGCDRHPRHLHHELHIVFRHRAMHAGNAGALLNHEVEPGFGWIRIAAKLEVFEDRLSSYSLFFGTLKTVPTIPSQPPCSFTYSPNSSSALILSRNARSLSFAIASLRGISCTQLGNSRAHGCSIAV